MQRFDFYFGQLVRQEDLDNAFDGAENADRAIVTDQGIAGINAGLAVTPSAVPNLQVEVSGGRGYDQQGRRIFVGATQTVNLADALPVGAGNQRYVAIVVQFVRALSDPRTDDNDVTIQYNRAESFVLTTVLGEEAGANPARPAKPADGLVLADVLLAQGQATILASHIDTTTNGRRDHAFELTGSTPAQVKAGRFEEVGQALLDQLNSHVTGAANAHNAEAIDFDTDDVPGAFSTVDDADNVQVAIINLMEDLQGGALTAAQVTATDPGLPGTVGNVQEAIAAGLSNDVVGGIWGIVNVSGAPTLVAGSGVSLNLNSAATYVTNNGPLTTATYTRLEFQIDLAAVGVTGTVSRVIVTANYADNSSNRARPRWCTVKLGSDLAANQHFGIDLHTTSAQPQETNGFSFSNRPIDLAGGANGGEIHFHVKVILA